MKRAFDIFALKGKNDSRKEALNKGIDKDAGLETAEPAHKRVKKFELTSAQKQRQELFREVVNFGEKGLEGEAAKAANYRWKQSLGIPMRKVSVPYPELKRKLVERAQTEATENIKRKQEGLPKFTRAPVIAHKKQKRTPRPEQTLQVMPGKYRKGAVQLEKRDISRIYSDVKKRPIKTKKSGKKNNT